MSNDLAGLSRDSGRATAMATQQVLEKPEPKRSKEEDLAAIALTWLLQVIGVAAGITFGVFSVLSWLSSQTANSQAGGANAQAETANDQAILANTQAKTANLLAFVALCEQSVRDGMLPYDGR